MLVVFGAAAPIVVVLVFAAGTGIGFALFDVWWNTAMAERVPASALSRVSSYDWMGSIVLLPVGFLLLAGPTAEATSPEAVMIVGGILTAELLVVGLVPRETRTLPRTKQAPSPAVEMHVLP